MQLPCSENICFTTTATPRPELLEKTYKSFSKNIPWLDFKKINLFLHLDRFPQRLDDSEDAKLEEVIKIARSYFGKVVYKVGMQPNFSNAVKWIFENADKEYVFNLEDDWELLCELSENFIQYFNDPNVIQVGLRSNRISNPRFVLSPSIMRKTFANEAGKILQQRKNPEVTIRSWNPHNLEKSFIYWPKQENLVILKDLGRAWMKNTAFGRGTDEWVSWKFLPNSTTRSRDQQIADQNAHIDYESIKNIEL